MYFAYGEAELSRLRQKDKRLCEVIDRIGHIDRAVDPDLFSSVVHHVVGQQISTKAQAVGGAVGHNPISLMIPCHRVVGTNGSLTGYGGGIARKVKLLELERADMHGLFVPKKGTAL